MLIDWFTVVAQIVNFLVLVALLKRFLWPRLLHSIDERETRIATQLSEADRKNQEAGRLLEQMRTQSAEQERHRNELIAQAQREAEDHRIALIQKAREEVQQLEARWHDDLRREQTAFLDEIRRRAGTEILAVMRKALSDLASADIQHSALQVFLKKLKTMDTATLRDLASRQMSVLSAAELPEQVQRQIESVFEQRLDAPVHPQFITTPAMAWGIELRSDGRRIGWTPDSYLESLEDKLRDTLERRGKSPAG